MAEALTFGSLFAGVGGFDLGFERAGMRCLWQVEIDPFCQLILAKHWPNVERFGDVRECGRHNLAAVDIICGGFPCQDISNAGRREGIEGKRSGLWSEFARIIRELRPRYVVVENVAALLGRGMGRVLGDLAACGYDAEWQCLPAAAFGAPHQRDRLFIVGYAISGGCASSCLEQIRPILRRRSKAPTGPSIQSGRKGWYRDQWSVEPNVGRVADGVPDRVDRLRALGNAVVPQVAEWLGRRIVEADRG